MEGDKAPCDHVANLDAPADWAVAPDGKLPKKVYRTPTIKELGSLIELTKGQGGSLADGNREHKH
jgi:hypothetical protein